MSWEELVERWPRSRGQALDLLRHEAIPVRARAAAWLRMSGAEALMAEGGASYEALLQQQTPHEEAIRKDIHRTFAVFHEIPGFDDVPEALVRGFRRTGSQKAAALGRVLRAYAVFDPEVGYHQGLNFVAGVVLLQVGEEADAFWTLAALLSGGLRALFRARRPTLKAEIERFELVLRQTLPELADHFRSCGFVPILFAVDWFSTFFTYSLPCSAALWVFDLIMAGMPDPLFRVGAGLLSVLAPTLRRLDFATLMHDFKTLSRSVDGQALRSAVWQLASQWPPGSLPSPTTPQALTPTSGPVPVPPSPPLFYPSASPATSLALAVSEGDLHTLRTLLMSRGYPSLVTGPLLHLACLSGCPDAALALLALGSAPVDWRIDYAWLAASGGDRGDLPPWATALRAACTPLVADSACNGDVAAAQGRATPTVGLTPLQVAVQLNRPTVARLLLLFGASRSAARPAWAATEGGSEGALPAAPTAAAADGARGAVAAVLSDRVCARCGRWFGWRVRRRRCRRLRVQSGAGEGRRAATATPQPDTATQSPSSGRDSAVGASPSPVPSPLGGGAWENQRVRKLRDRANSLDAAGGSSRPASPPLGAGSPHSVRAELHAVMGADDASSVSSARANSRSRRRKAAAPAPAPAPPASRSGVPGTGGGGGAADREPGAYDPVQQQEDLGLGCSPASISSLAPGGGHWDARDGTQGPQHQSHGARMASFPSVDDFGSLQVPRSGSPDLFLNPYSAAPETPPAPAPARPASASNLFLRSATGDAPSLAPNGGVAGPPRLRSRDRSGSEALPAPRGEEQQDWAEGSGRASTQPALAPAVAAAAAAASAAGVISRTHDLRTSSAASGAHTPTPAPDSAPAPRTEEEGCGCAFCSSCLLAHTCATERETQVGARTTGVPSWDAALLPWRAAGKVTAQWRSWLGGIGAEPEELPAAWLAPPPPVADGRGPASVTPLPGPAHPHRVSATEAAEEWHCAECATLFTTFVRRHHCRRCRAPLCDLCSRERIYVVPGRSTAPVRACRSCRHFTGQCPCPDPPLRAAAASDPRQAARAKRVVERGRALRSKDAQAEPATGSGNATPAAPCRHRHVDLASCLVCECGACLAARAVADLAAQVP